MKIPILELKDDSMLAVVENHLWKYRDDKARAESIGRNKSLEWLSVDYTRIRSSSHRNGTEAAVIATVSDADELFRWCKVFERTYERFRFDAKEDLIRERYLNHKNVHQVCIDICISENTFRNWRREILDIAMRWAIELNLIDPP